MRSLKMLLMGAAALLIMAVAKPALAVNFTCTPLQVGSFEGGAPNNRVHVLCTTSTPDAGNNIFFFAVPAADTAYANRFISIATAALTTGRTLVIGFTSGKSTDLNNAAFGCLSTDCRYASSIIIQ